MKNWRHATQSAARRTVSSESTPLLRALVATGEIETTRLLKNTDGSRKPADRCSLTWKSDSAVQSLSPKETFDRETEE